MGAAIGAGVGQGVGDIFNSLLNSETAASQAKLSQQEFNQQLGFSQNQYADWLANQSQLGGLKDQVTYQLANQLMQSPTQFNALNYGAPTNTSASGSPGGFNMNALANAASKYTSGAGGTNTDVADATLGGMGFNNNSDIQMAYNPGSATYSYAGTTYPNGTGPLASQTAGNAFDYTGQTTTPALQAGGTVAPGFNPSLGVGGTGTGTGNASGSGIGSAGVNGPSQTGYNPATGTPTTPGSTNGGGTGSGGIPPGGGSSTGSTNPQYAGGGLGATSSAASSPFTAGSMAGVQSTPTTPSSGSVAPTPTFNGSTPQSAATGGQSSSLTSPTTQYMLARLQALQGTPGQSANAQGYGSLGQLGAT